MSRLLAWHLRWHQLKGSKTLSTKTFLTPQVHCGQYEVGLRNIPPDGSDTALRERRSAFVKLGFLRDI